MIVVSIKGDSVLQSTCVDTSGQVRAIAVIAWSFSVLSFGCCGVPWVGIATWSIWAIFCVLFSLFVLCGVQFRDTSMAASLLGASPGYWVKCLNSPTQVCMKTRGQGGRLLLDGQFRLRENSTLKWGTLFLSLVH